MRIMLSLGVINLLAASAFAQQSSTSPQAPPKELPQLEHFSTTNADSRAEPCDDFYKYADGKWLAAHPIPADQVTWGVASPLQLWNETVLLQTLEQNSADNPKRTPNEQKVGDYYFACMDTKAIDAHTAEWLKPELDRIASIKDKTGVAEEVAHLHQTIPGAWEGNDNATDAALFGFSGQPDFDDASHNVAGIDQGGMALPGRSFYLDEDAKAKEIRAKYLKHVANIFVLSGEKPGQAKTDADVVLAMETEMAKVAMDPVARRDPKNLNNKMSLAQVKALTPSFDWDLYLKLVKAPPSAPHYLVTSPDFFKGLEVLLNQHPLDHWKTYFRWQMLHGSARALSEAFVREDFDFFNHTLFGAQELQPRWRRCVRATDANLGEALGQVYVERAFPPSSKRRVLQLVQDLQAVLSKDIEAADWMTPETKKQAQVKLRATLNKIGYPDKWRDYSSVSIGRSSYLLDRQHTTTFEYHRWVNKIGTPLDRTEWGMTPPTINAYEDPQSNTVNFPAGILQPPYFDPQQDDVVNYGAIGAIIGHEIIHGFDDQGRKFDAQGNLRDWWTESDGKQYDLRGKCIADQYTQEIPEAGAGVKQDGRLTQGEDTADNGGLHLALLALQSDLAREGKSLSDKGSDGFTNLQRFFLSYAFGWCEQYRPELIRTLVLTNPHSYPKYRVNNVVSNMPEFKQAFGCHEGQKMVRQNFCRIW
ncbi:MAG TPA: M13 family metallopeptidase [Candidatus Acidoferrum sp.]|nr:M13 family metallopeptidase [Candidatus Acidoferrum sp.]